MKELEHYDISILDDDVYTLNGFTTEKETNINESLSNQATNLQNEIERAQSAESALNTRIDNLPTSGGEFLGYVSITTPITYGGENLSININKLLLFDNAVWCECYGELGTTGSTLHENGTIDYDGYISIASTAKINQEISSYGVKIKETPDTTSYPLPTSGVTSYGQNDSEHTSDFMLSGYIGADLALSNIYFHSKMFTLGQSIKTSPMFTFMVMLPCEKIDN